MPNKPIRLEAKIKFIEETDELRKEAASIVDLPKTKTPDVLFFTGCFVSSGENLNHAYFMPSELVKAHNTIINKPMDIEHEENSIVGHIFSSVFMDHSGNKLDMSDLEKMDTKTLDKMNIDVVIGGVMYKSRFPELAEEIKDNKWKLSMETYFQDYDVKVGDLLLTKQEAEAMGLASTDVLGKFAKVVRRGVELAAGEVARVLRDLLFSGCGFVKQPANPRSLIFETAKKLEEGDTIVVELDGTEDIKFEKADVSVTDVRTQTSVGICVSYKKFVYANEPAGPNTELLHENWCALFEEGCTSFGRDTTDPNCLLVVAEDTAHKHCMAKLKDLNERDNRGKLLQSLKDILKKSN